AGVGAFSGTTAGTKRGGGGVGDRTPSRIPSHTHAWPVPSRQARARAGGAGRRRTTVWRGAARRRDCAPSGNLTHHLVARLRGAQQHGGRVRGQPGAALGRRPMNGRGRLGRPQAHEVAPESWCEAGWQEVADRLAAEEPLQLLIAGQPLSIVMRTPGRDVELVLGLLWAERVITDRTQVHHVRLSAETGESELDDAPFRVDADLMEANQVDVNLESATGRRLDRSFLSSSACGV